MKLIRTLLVTSLVILAVGATALLAWTRLGHPTTVRTVPTGDGEIVWIASATSTADWERFVAALQLARARRKVGPTMLLDDAKAYPQRSYEIPEIAISFVGCTGKLWLRWYKVTSEMSIPRWMDELAKRPSPPLAVIGGSSSAEALDIAQAFADPARRWPLAKPLFLITQATADRIWDKGIEGPELMRIYPDRSFRFCFQNSQMAEAVLDFTWSRPELRPTGNPPAVHRLEWQDNPYSLDLSNQFVAALQQKKLPHALKAVGIRYSVGDFNRPNPPECLAIENLSADLTATEERSLLILPIGAQPARRLLHVLTSTAPKTRNVVAVSGDSIGLNTIRRDRDEAWNVQDVPVPLVIFCHHHPEDPDVTYVEPGTRERRNATDILLLHLSLIDKVIKAAYDWQAERPGLAADADELRERLRDQQRDFFDVLGNRLPDTGEHVIYLRPHVHADQVQPVATLEVWARDRETPNGATRWQRKLTEQLEYNQGYRASNGHATN